LTVFTGDAQSEMMQKYLWIIAVLFAICGAQVAMADPTQYDVTFNKSVGSSVTGVYSANGSSVASFSLTLPDNKAVTLIANSAIASGVTCIYTGGSCASHLNALLIDLQSNGGGRDRWVETQGFGTDTFQITVNGNTFSFTFGRVDTSSDQGSSWSNKPAPVPEPQILWLALVGIVFTRNRISQGLRQALRWNS
jgi:hypothetical protein